MLQFENISPEFFFSERLNKCIVCMNAYLMEVNCHLMNSNKRFAIKNYCYVYLHLKSMFLQWKGFFLVHFYIVLCYAFCMFTKLNKFL
jgi:hypothetical protein